MKKKKSVIVKPKGFTKVERPTAKAVWYTGHKVAQLRQSQVVHASASRQLSRSLSWKLLY